MCKIVIFQRSFASLIAALFFILFSLYLLGEKVVEKEVDGNGVSVVKWESREVLVKQIEDMNIASRSVSEAFKTNTVVSFIMSEASNANEEFFKDLGKCHTVKRVVLTNSRGGNYDFGEVVSLFPDANSLTSFWTGVIDVDFRNHKNLTLIDVDGAFSSQAIATLKPLSNLEYVSFFIDEKITFEDLLVLKFLPSLDTADLSVPAGYEVPEDLIEKVDNDLILSRIVRFK